MKVTISLFGLLAVLLTMPSSAQGIYKWEDENGQTHYSDVPQEGAIEIELQPVQTFAAPAVKSTANEDRADNKKKQGYEAFEISSPSDEETIWNNGGTISVNLTASPALKEGHLILLYLDGKSVAEPAKGTSAQIPNVERGTHTLQAELLDSKGRSLMKSSLITIYVQLATGDAKLLRKPIPVPPIVNPPLKSEPSREYKKQTPPGRVEQKNENNEVFYQKNRRVREKRPIRRPN
jgi:hypothetical protein